ncbi:diguanylate cyclase (GGDEF) domain-containing protein [Phyllobacterium sp. YR620]|uniref:sensor domain-containing diguanylate cyclase n=1 Tax=Phyllobacterium sp. YR620 TaxID=1881066 RepID=UPI00088D2C8E|nr:sensor domain-containing diguanylate cyclase [Phyllobacterium sp. YR620]SDP43729.1 diguanylate cyclase (GGDEF) domain-containing protein [Phyllobacterium sp. YR620]
MDSSKRADAILDNLLSLQTESLALVAVYDEDDVLRYANKSFRAAYHLTPDEQLSWGDIMRRNFLAGVGTVLKTADFEEWLRSTQSRRGKTAFRSFETDLADGRWLWMTETVQSNGWMLCIASDITPLRADDRWLRQDRDLALRASQTDELTGIANRRFIMTRLEALASKTPAPGIDIGCIAVLDIDYFKSINDRYGHQSGDVVLLDFARHGHSFVRRLDCFGRIGGEEFMFILPDTNIENGLAILERVFSKIRTSRPLPSYPEVSYTCSAGMTALKPGDTAQDAFARADKGLYQAKLDGRDRIVAI